MRKISDDIKNGSYEKIYLLYGTEEYLKKQYKNNLRTAICGDDTMNYSYFEGKECDTKTIVEIAETLPFFADRRLIIMEHSGFFKSANEEMVKYLDNVCESTCMVFVESEVDKRGKMYKSVKELGYICEMNEQNQASLEKWIVGILNNNGKKITGNNMEYFLNNVGSEMENISNELEKLITYTMDKEVIDREDIDSVCSVQITAKIFDMIDAMSDKNRKKALSLYYDLIASKEPPMRILFMLSRQFNIMLQVCELSEHGLSNGDIAKKAAVQPFIVGKILRQLKNGFKGEILTKALKDCIKIESDIKNGKMDENAGVEMILIKYS